MKRSRIHTLGIIASAMFAIAAGPAAADTVANGPYYATPSWDQKLQCDTSATCPRFVVLANWNNGAVLDRETGYVWERTPSTAQFSLATAKRHCATLSLANRYGWRLPSFSEIATLFDSGSLFVPSNSNAGVKLAPGHPFAIGAASVGQPHVYYWTTTGSASFITTVNLDGEGLGSLPPTQVFDQAWCVRGGAQLDTEPLF